MRIRITIENEVPHTLSHLTKKELISLKKSIKEQIEGELFFSRLEKETVYWKVKKITIGGEKE